MPDTDLMKAEDVRAMIGGISAMTEWRWRKYHGFPAPLKIARRNYYRRRDVEAWLHRFEERSDT